MDTLPHFFMKMAITQLRMIQIPKFLCLKSLTNIWPSFGNIDLISKVCKIELEGKKFKTSKNRSIFYIKIIKIAFSQKFSKV